MVIVDRTFIIQQIKFEVYISWNDLKAFWFIDGLSVTTSNRKPLYLWMISQVYNIQVGIDAPNFEQVSQVFRGENQS